MFWARLLTYRPLFLLGGLWLTLVCVSAIAYHGLMFNQPIEDTSHRDLPIAIVTPPLPSAAPNAAPNSLPPLDTPPEVEPTEAPHSGTVILWGLFSLVGLCAFGCFVLTQQIKASARPKRKKVRPAAKTPAPVRPPQPKRLTPYLPQRDDMVVPGVRAVTASPPATPPQPLSPQPAPPAFRPVARATARAATAPAVAQRSTLAARRSRPQPGGQAAAEAQAQPPARTPAVVPEGTDLPLDWSEGSVAHALDMRQRRSLSSLM
ncbi:MAG: hypothetical protein EA368_08010 [Leptolyngbya sp. DLM2.Bin27]|nr:MAG: hypothetical protein EA368_08010 [Leptolyngbya sp. DLM2.Bin27]